MNLVLRLHLPAMPISRLPNASLRFGEIHFGWVQLRGTFCVAPALTPWLNMAAHALNQVKRSLNLPCLPYNLSILNFPGF